jgi:hypothetical protein
MLHVAGKPPNRFVAGRSLAAIKGCDQAAGAHQCSANRNVSEEF